MTKRFEVKSTILDQGTIIWGSDFDIKFERPDGVALSWTWRIVAAQSPAKWHKGQRREAMEAGKEAYRDPWDEDDEDGNTNDDDVDQAAFDDPAPDGKWITFVTHEGEVLGFQILRELS